MFATLFLVAKYGVSSRALECVQVEMRNMQCCLMYCGAQQKTCLKIVELEISNFHCCRKKGLVGEEVAAMEENW